MADVHSVFMAEAAALALAATIAQALRFPNVPFLLDSQQLVQARVWIPNSKFQIFFPAPA